MLSGSLSWQGESGPQHLAVRRTNKALERMRGLLFRDEPESGTGLLIDPCNSIHMIGMPYALDVIYLDQSYQVVKLVEAIKPWRFSACSKAIMTLECATETIKEFQISPGLKMQWTEENAEL